MVPKSDSVEVDDWYSEGMPKVTIELDPRLDGPGNVERLFKRYRRARVGLQTVELERLVRPDGLRGGWRTMQGVRIMPIGRRH